MCKQTIRPYEGMPAHRDESATLGGISNPAESRRDKSGDSRDFTPAKLLPRDSKNMPRQSRRSRDLYPASSKKVGKSGAALTRRRRRIRLMFREARSSSGTD